MSAVEFIQDQMWSKMPALCWLQVYQYFAPAVEVYSEEGPWPSIALYSMVF